MVLRVWSIRSLEGRAWDSSASHPSARPSNERIDQTRSTMHALGQAFAKFADDVAEPQLQELDLDLKVLNDALKADLETAK